MCMGWNPAFPWGCSSSPIPGAFRLFCSHSGKEQWVDICTSLLASTLMWRVSLRSVCPPRGTPLAGAEIPPGSIRRQSKRVYLHMCQNKGQKSSVYLCSINSSAFLAFLGDGLFPLSPPSPILSSPASCASPSHLPGELFSLRGIGAGRFSCGQWVQPWQPHTSWGGALWVSSRPLTHCRRVTGGDHISLGELSRSSLNSKPLSNSSSSAFEFKDSERRKGFLKGTRAADGHHHAPAGCLTPAMLGKGCVNVFLCLVSHVVMFWYDLRVTDFAWNKGSLQASIPLPEGGDSLEMYLLPFRLQPSAVIPFGAFFGFISPQNTHWVWEADFDMPGQILLPCTVYGPSCFLVHCRP